MLENFLVDISDVLDQQHGTEGIQNYLKLHRLDGFYRSSGSTKVTVVDAYKLNTIYS